MNKYRDWEILDELPQGWSIDKTAGSPAPNTVFVTNGKSVLSGLQKRALLKVEAKRDINTPKNELTMNGKPMIAMGRSNLAMQQVLDLLVVRHRFLIRFDFSSKSVQKLANLCKKYPPKVIIIDSERKINDTLGIKYYSPTGLIEFVY